MAKKSKFKLPILHKDKNANTAIYILIAGSIVFIGWKLYKKYGKSETETTPFSPGTPSGGSAVAPVVKPTPISNETVFSLKNPRMKNERVQWMQNAYNDYARARKNYGLTPDWTIISEDSIFGPATEAAINRIMGKKSANWTEVKARATYLTGELQSTTWSGSGGSW